MKVSVVVIYHLAVDVFILKISDKAGLPQGKSAPGTCVWYHFWTRPILGEIDIKPKKIHLAGNRHCTARRHNAKGDLYSGPNNNRFFGPVSSH